MDEVKYPEHEKQHAIVDKSQAIGEFLDWMSQQGIHRMRYEEFDTWVHDSRSIECLLAEYFNINLDTIETEKRAMLDEIRKLNEVHS